MKTIDINAKEWFDKVNGNSYFSARITLDYGMDSSKEIILPFQYGYGNHYIDMSGEELLNQGLIKVENFTPLWRSCRENNVILRTNKHENCLKRDVIKWGS